MNHHAADTAIANEKIRSATHHEEWKIFGPAKSDQPGKGLLISRLDPELSRPAYAKSRVLRERLIETNVTVVAHDLFQPFCNNQVGSEIAGKIPSANFFSLVPSRLAM
jgi:hypothetical protein